MLKKTEFRKLLIIPLSVFYGEPTEDQADNLFDIFKDKHPEILTRAVEMIQEDYPYKTFPNPYHIHQAIDRASQEYSYLMQEPTEEDCDKCYGMGIVLVERFDEFYGENRKFSVPCDCPVGERIKKAWKDHHKKHKYLRNKAKITKAVTEDPY